MRKLIGNLRPDVDETSLHDDANFDGPRPPGPARRERLLVSVLITAVGVFLLAGFFLIGSHVDWVLTDTIATARSSVWAWVPMTLFALGGVLLTAGGAHMLRGSLRRDRTR